MWGLTIENAVRAWGARAIFGKSGRIELLPDRQSWSPDEKPDPGFLHWINKVALPWLRAEVKKRGILPSGRDELELRQDNYVLKATPNASWGYLYIGAGQLAAKEQRRTMDVAQQN